MTALGSQTQIESFVVELLNHGVKTAAPIGLAARVAELARSLGAKPRYGVGALLGGGAGALTGAGTTAPGEEPDINRRALIGGALGALGGMGAAKGLHWLGAAKATGTGADRLARMLHSQYYGATGRVLGQSRMTEPQIKATVKGLDMGPEAAREALAKAAPGENLKPLQARLEAANMGIETLPGVVKGLVTKPVKTVGTAWRALTPLGKVVTLGSSVFPVREISRTRKEEYGPGKEFLSRKQHILTEIGKNLGYVAAGAAPVAPLIGAGTALGELGKTIGSVV